MVDRWLDPGLRWQQTRWASRWEPCPHRDADCSASDVRPELKLGTRRRLPAQSQGDEPVSLVRLLDRALSELPGALFDQAQKATP
jgi:hypothetical protein